MADGGPFFSVNAASYLGQKRSLRATGFRPSPSFRPGFDLDDFRLS
jgi:hypothetical protein